MTADEPKQLTRRDFLKAMGTAFLGLALSGCEFAPAVSPSPTTTPIPGGPRVEISRARVAIRYENITDGVLTGRIIGQTTDILKETHTDLVFRGFWKWLPVVDSPDSIPPELLELAPQGTTLEQAADALRRSGYYYQELQRWIGAIKKEIPNLIFVGSIPAQGLFRVEYNPITEKVYSTNETWAMALDPQKWNIARNGSPVTKEELQRWWHERWPYGGRVDPYDWQKTEMYLPDITNPIYQDLLLSWAKKQIDCGADAIWIDMLYVQAGLLSYITEDIHHPSVRESFEDASKIIDEIHKYGESRGKHIYVGTWSWYLPSSDIAEVLKQISGGDIPYSAPGVDFLTMAPSVEEVENKAINESKWEEAVLATRKEFGDIPIFAFIDDAQDVSQTVSFSQKLSSEEQREVLRTFDSSFTKMGVNFIYPLHGGYMGNGEITTKLAWGKYRTYDALAPEFDTYPTIRELAQRKASRDIPE